MALENNSIGGTDSEEEHRLFEACARNPYAEPFGIESIADVIAAVESVAASDD